MGYAAHDLYTGILELFAEGARKAQIRKHRRSFTVSRVAEHELRLRLLLRRGVRLERVLGTGIWLERREGRATYQNITTGKTQAMRSPSATRRAWRLKRTVQGLCWHCPEKLAATSKTCCEACLARR